MSMSSDLKNILCAVLSVMFTAALILSAWLRLHVILLLFLATISVISLISMESGFPRKENNNSV